MKINKLLESKKLKEGYSHFEFTSGANPYIAKTKDEVERIKRSRGDSVKYVGNINGIDYYKVDDSEEERDLFRVDDLDEGSIPRNALKIRATDRMNKKSIDLYKHDKYWKDSEGEDYNLYDPAYLRKWNDIEVLETDPNYKPNRTKPEYVVQGNYGYGWEDLTASDDYTEARSDLKAYRENETGVPHRLITRRVPVNENLKEASKPSDSEIQKEYDNYCKDLGIDSSKKSSKNRFISDYGKHLNDLYGIKDIESKLTQTSKAIKEVFKPSNSGIQSVKCYNRYNYTIQELRVDNDNKTFERGNFTAGKADKKTKNRQEFEDIVDTLKELGYTEIKSDYRSMRNKSRKGNPTSVEEGYELSPRIDYNPNHLRDDEGKVMADRWYASKWPDDEVGIEQLQGITLDDALKDRSILGHCDTQVRERVYAQLDKYIPLSVDSPMYKERNESKSTHIGKDKMNEWYTGEPDPTGEVEAEMRQQAYLKSGAFQEDKQYVIDLANEGKSVGHPIEDYNEFKKICKDAGVYGHKLLWHIYQDTIEGKDVTNEGCFSDEAHERFIKRLCEASEGFQKEFYCDYVILKNRAGDGWDIYSYDGTPEKVTKAYLEDEGFATLQAAKDEIDKWNDEAKLDESVTINEGVHKIYVNGELRDEIESNNPIFDVDKKAYEYKKMNGVKNVRVVYADGSSFSMTVSDLKESSYGGAFDIKDDQYFTREDIENAAEEVLNHINETFTEPYHLGGTWFEDGQWIVNVQGEQFDEYEVSISIDMRRIKEPWHLKKAYASDMATKLISQIKEYNGLNEDTSISSRYEFDDDVDDLTYYYDDEELRRALEEEPYNEITSKQVPDVSGFLTDYTMYQNMNTGEYVFVFGDKDIYRPEDGNFDWECETKEEAEEWFNNYKGFDEDEFEDFEESYEVDKVFSAACNNRMDYMKRGFAKGKIDPNARYHRFNSDHSYIMGALRNGNKDMVKYLQDQGGTILDSEQDEYNWLMNEEAEGESPILHKKGDGSYLVASENGDGYTAFNKSDVCMGHISANNEQEAKNKFNSNQFDEDLNK